MDEFSKIFSRLGQVSTAISVLNFGVAGILIVVRMNIPSGWMNTEDIDRLEHIAKWVFLGNWAIALFPVFALIGLIIGVGGYFQPNSAKFYSLLGMALNGFELLIWIVGMIGYQIIFHNDRFYVK